MGCAKSVRRRHDAGLVLCDTRAPTDVPGGHIGEASEGRVEMGANVGLSDTRAVHIDLRQAVHQRHLQSARRVGIHQHAGQLL